MLSNLVEVNAGGEVLFYSTITGASGDSEAGIFAGDGSSSRVVARVGDAIPSGATIRSIFDSSIHFNDRGQVTFAAVLKFDDPQAPINTVALFLHDPDSGLIEIAREQEAFEDLGTITRLLPNFRERAGDVGQRTLNASGQIVYRAFVGGNAVIFRWSPPAGINPSVLPSPAIESVGDSIVLRWPPSDPGLVLESTTDPENSQSWQARAEIIPVLDESTLKVEIPATKRREFFRLRRTE